MPRDPSGSTGGTLRGIFVSVVALISEIKDNDYFLPIDAKLNKPDTHDSTGKLTKHNETTEMTARLNNKMTHSLNGNQEYKDI